MFSSKWVVAIGSQYHVLELKKKKNYYSVPTTNYSL